MSYTIARNYRDRKSSYKWLVRKTDEDIEKAIAVKSVNAGNVRFELSNRREEGFGCKVVAVAETATWQDPEPFTENVELIFDYDKFRRNDNINVVVREAKEITLTANGAIYALLNA